MTNLEHFKKFIEKYIPFEEFISRWDANRCSRTLEDIVEKEIHQVIAYAFKWTDQIEGKKYWNNIDGKWYDYVNKVHDAKK